MKSNNLLLIVGPSGAGKTTLEHNLCLNYHFILPICMTSRGKRLDDNQDLFIYTDNNNIKANEENNNFILCTGSGIKYGYLKPAPDCTDPIIIITSYKYVERMLLSKYNVAIFALQFSNIEESIHRRLSFRNVDLQVIQEKIKYALDEEEKYYEFIEKKADLIIKTDELDAIQTYEQASEWIDKNHFAEYRQYKARTLKR